MIRVAIKIVDAARDAAPSARDQQPKHVSGMGSPVLEGYMPVLEVKTIEPLAMSPDAAATLLSVNKRTIYRLIAEKKLIARKEGSRTLVDYQSVKKHYESLPLLSGAPIPNAPQMMTIARKRRARA
jgi:excisionase family DNA binding protein